MSIWMQILGIVAAGFIIWLLYRGVKGNTQMFSKESVSKSFLSMGILALILIAFVAFLVFLVR